MLSGSCVAQTGSSGKIVAGDSIQTQAPRKQVSGKLKGDSINADSLAFTLKHKRFQPNPKKAGMYSSILPGLGQLYNRQYWKIPLVYAGVSVSAYYIIKNLDDYQTYRKAYIGRINNPYPTDQYVRIYNVDQLKQLQDDSKKFLDLTVLFSGIGYAFQVIDAVVSAHLKNFDMSRDISLKMKPVAFPSGVGVGLVMNFK
jgi:hypothetical protein